MDIGLLKRNLIQEAIQIHAAFKSYFISPEGPVPCQIRAIAQFRTRYN